jgi:RNA polymerase sigma factor (TIGR02999 family)
MDDSESLRTRVTGALHTVDPGDTASLDALVGLLYGELRVMAHRQLARELPGHTLQTTALVHEAWFKLVEGSDVGRRGRSYFFAAAARAMRQVLVDHARRRDAAKRGHGEAPIGLDDVQLAAVDSFAAELLDLEAALERLAKLEPRHAQVVECRYFAGFSVEETAEALGVSPRTVKSDWALAKAWLYDAIGGRGDA